MVPPSFLKCSHPPSLCPTNISRCPHFTLSYFSTHCPPSSWSSLGTPRGRKTAANSDTTKWGGGEHCYSSDGAQIHSSLQQWKNWEAASVSDNANECCTEATLIFLSQHIKSHLLLNLSQPSALTTEVLACLRDCSSCVSTFHHEHAQWKFKFYDRESNFNTLKADLS